MEGIPDEFLTNRFNIWKCAQRIKHRLKNKKWSSDSDYIAYEVPNKSVDNLNITWEVIKASHHEQFHDEALSIEDLYNDLDPVDPL